MHEYDEKLDDGSPNPKQDKPRHDHGMDLVHDDRSSPEGRVRHIVGASSDCGTRPLRQVLLVRTACVRDEATWNADEWYWCGGPVCEVCAKQRAPNERVVQFEGQKILLLARDPTVPTDWHAPRRRRKRT